MILIYFPLVFRILKTIIFVFFVGLLLNCCKTRGELTGPLPSYHPYFDTVITDTHCVPYFQYDEIVYYRYIEITDTLSVENKNAAEDSLFDKVYYNHYHLKSLEDSLFVYELENIGYKKFTIPTSVYHKLDKIFCERTPKVHPGSRCIPAFRDVFVFRRQHSIIGIAKICFSCRQRNIVGTERDTEYFGQTGDFNRLKAIVKSLYGE